MDCPSCGSTQRDIAKFCDQCGRALALPEAPPPTDFTRTFPKPPPLPKKIRGTLADKFQAMGTLAGRTRAEIESVVGPPNSAFTTYPPGCVQLDWLDQDNWTGTIHYSISLVFDQNGICGGVTHESSSR